MENKMDVKAMKARFQGNGPSVDAPSPPAAHIKPPLKPTHSTGLKTPPQKPLLENRPPKPAFLQNAVPTKSDTAVPELNKTKMLASKFTNIQDDTNTKGSADNKQPIHFKLPPTQPPEPKVSPKPPLNKPPVSTTLLDSKPTFPKPSLAVASKPSWIKEDNGGGAPSSTTTLPKPPPLQQKPASGFVKLWQQNQEPSSPEVAAAHKPSPAPNTTKPTSNFRAAQNLFNKDNNMEQPDNNGVKKTPLSNTKSIPPEKPPASKKPSLKKRLADPHHSCINGDDTSGPKRNPLPNILALGAAPAKPNRPPNVNLQNFKIGAEAQNDGSGIIKKSTTLTLNSNPSNHGSQVTPSPPVPQAPLPSLPPGHPGAIIQQEEFYDDVEELNRCRPPLPPTSGHPSQRAKEDTDDEDDGEMYEDLEERWDAAEQKQEKKKEKDMKDEKKRLEKDQKEREKKEQDAKKRFKLVCPIEVIQQGKVCVDAKGCKTDLSLKLGDSLDIIRVQGNPEGKWLARAKDGSIGYVKITSVQIDFDSLKHRQAQQKYEPEVYDDIDLPSFDNSGPKGGGGENDGEIYDDVADLSLEVNPLNSRSPSVKPHSFLRIFDRNARPFSVKVMPPPARFSSKGNTDRAEDDEIYDDVDSQSAPPLPPISSLSGLKAKSKTESLDPKKQKKLEKEEKDFRKKFKYDGEIKVLYQVTIISTLTNKKWSGNELSVKAGEKLDVIVGAVDNKLICRNEEGKFGYVSTSHIVHEDGEIYDDIGDDCIYDND